MMRLGIAVLTVMALAGPALAPTAHIICPISAVLAKRDDDSG